MNLTWTPVLDATSYDIYRSNIKITSTTSLSFLDSNLINGQTYTYCIVAVNTKIRSTKSNCASVTPMHQEVFAAGSLVPLGWNFIFDSNNNLFSSNIGGGLLKTSSIGTKTVFFSGKSVILVGKDSADNIYLLVDGIGNFPANGSNAASISIQKISPAGNVSTFCNSNSCSSMPVIQGIANGGGVFDSQGNLFIPVVIWAPLPNITNGNFAFSQIVKISASGTYSIFSGATVPAGDNRCVDANFANATFSGIGKMHIDNSDNIYVFDRGINAAVCNSIRKITPSGNVTTTYNFGSKNITGPVWDSSENFYFSEYTSPSTGSLIQKMSSTGATSTYCGGKPYPASITGHCTQTYFNQIVGNLTFDTSGNLYFLMNASALGADSYLTYKVIPH